MKDKLFEIMQTHKIKAIPTGKEMTGFAVMFDNGDMLNLCYFGGKVFIWGSDINDPICKEMFDTVKREQNDNSRNPSKT